jgi:predicted transcriptional regulator
MKKPDYRELTPAELQVMQILWTKKKALARDVLNEMDEPKPAYNTVSTVIRVLEKKGFVGHKAYGTTYEYYPLVKKKEYTSNFMQNVMHNFFGGNRLALLSYFAGEEDMTVEELEELNALVRKVEERKKQEG